MPGNNPFLISSLRFDVELGDSDSNYPDSAYWSVGLKYAFNLIYIDDEKTFIIYTLRNAFANRMWPSEPGAGERYWNGGIKLSTWTKAGICGKAVWSKLIRCLRVWRITRLFWEPMSLWLVRHCSIQPFRLDGAEGGGWFADVAKSDGSLWRTRCTTVIRNANISFWKISIIVSTILADEDREWWKGWREGFESVYLFWVGSSLRADLSQGLRICRWIDVSAYQLPRQHVDTCFKEIVVLLDEAAPYILMHNQRESGLRAHDLSGGRCMP